MENKQLYSLITPYRCPICNQDMLFFASSNNRIIDYKKFISYGKSLSEMKAYLEKRDIKFLKCIACERTFIIDWTSNWPTPLTDIDILKKFSA